jgi:hypothetical protein
LILKHPLICLRNWHFIETRANTGFAACQVVVFHIVIHNKRFKNGFLRHHCQPESSVLF